MFVMLSSPFAFIIPKFTVKFNPELCGKESMLEKVVNPHV